MKQNVAVTLCIIHVLAFAISTYIAAVDIESILVTGWICSATGLIAGIASLIAKKRSLSAVSFMTPLVAITLTLLEACVLELGPSRAALPFCIIFIVVQLTTNFVTFLSINEGAKSKQLSIKTLLVATFAFAVFFAIVRYLLKREHDTIMLIALTLAGLTFVGIVLSIHQLISSRRKPSGERISSIGRLNE